MSIRALGAVLVAIVISAQGLAAQQPQRQMRDTAARGMMMGNDVQQQMRVMDSMNARLDTLVQRMNRATGNAKVNAMARVINELVAQRRMMQTHMHRMMELQGKMGGGMMMGADAESMGAQMGGPKPPAKPSAGDTSDHGDHHPER